MFFLCFVHVMCPICTDLLGILDASFMFNFSNELPLEEKKLVPSHKYRRISYQVSYFKTNLNINFKRWMSLKGLSYPCFFSRKLLKRPFPMLDRLSFTFNIIKDMSFILFQIGKTV